MVSDVVWDFSADRFRIRPLDVSRRAWRGHWRYKAHATVLQAVEPYARLAINIGEAAAWNDELEDMEFRLHEIAYRLNQGYLPTGNFRCFVFLRSCFLGQLVHAVETRAAEFEEGTRYSTQRVAYVTTWVHQVMEHFADGGELNIVPHFSIFVSHAIDLPTFQAIVGRINWMRTRFDRNNQIISVFLQVS